MIICSLYTPNYVPIAAPFLASLKRHALDMHTVIVERDFDLPLLASLEKPTLMLSLLRQYDDAVVWLDADTIIRRPLHVLEAILENADLTVLHRPYINVLGPLGTLCAGKFNTGVVGVANTDAGRTYLERWAEAIALRPLADRYLDQEAAYLAWHDVRSATRFHPLPAGYNDSRFMPKSAIWHGKGSSRRHILFVLETVRYARGLPLGGVIDVLQCARKLDLTRRAYGWWWNRREATAAPP